MTTALYVRVSTAEQNAELQIRELRAYAARRGLEITETFQDVAGGADRTRPELRRLLTRAKAGFLESVLVWKLDRFGRSLLDCLQNLETLDRENVRFIAVNQNLEVDRGNPTSRLLLHVLGAAAEFERELIRDRARSGVRRYQEDYAAGRVGRDVHSKTGRDLPPHRPIAVLDLSKVIQLRKQGVPVPAIAKRLGISESTVWRRIRRQESPAPLGRPATFRPQDTA